MISDSHNCCKEDKGKEIGRDEGMVGGEGAGESL